MFDTLPEEFSHLYLAIGGVLAAVICISDPLRLEAADVVSALRALGLKKIVMLTGDSERTAAAIAAQVGVDEYRSEVLPEDKARYVEEARAAGHTVIMLGDGINDSPALAAADVSVAMSDASDIARTVADVTIMHPSLEMLLTTKDLAVKLMRRIESDYRFIAAFNTGLIGLGLAGVMTPTATATLHNLSTVGIAASNMRQLLPEAEDAAALPAVGSNCEQAEDETATDHGRYDIYAAG